MLRSLFYEHSEQARAPHTNGPRDLPRCGVSEFTTKAATSQGDSKELLPCLCVVGLNPVASRARIYGATPFTNTGEFTFLWPLFYFELYTKAAISHGDSKELLPCRCVVGLNPIVSVPASTAQHPLRARRIRLSAALIPLRAFFSETRERSRAHSLGFKNQIGRG